MLFFLWWVNSVLSETPYGLSKIPVKANLVCLGWDLPCQVQSGGWNEWLLSAVMLVSRMQWVNVKPRALSSIWASMSDYCYCHFSHISSEQLCHTSTQIGPLGDGGCLFFFLSFHMTRQWPSLTSSFPLVLEKACWTLLWFQFNKTKRSKSDHSLHLFWN